MATVSVATDGQSDEGDLAGVRVMSWVGLQAGDYGEAAAVTSFSDRSVQVVGSFGTGGKVIVQGSNNGTDWATLNDPQGNALDLLTAKIEAVSELTRWIRPYVPTGDVTTLLSVVLLAKRSGR